MLGYIGFSIPISPGDNHRNIQKDLGPHQRPAKETNLTHSDLQRRFGEAFYNTPPHPLKNKKDASLRCTTSRKKVEQR